MGGLLLQMSAEMIDGGGVKLFGAVVRIGSGALDVTKIVTVGHRYVIVNQTGEPLLVRQVGGGLTSACFYLRIIFDPPPSARLRRPRPVRPPHPLRAISLAPRSSAAPLRTRPPRLWGLLVRRRRPRTRGGPCLKASRHRDGALPQGLRQNVR